MDPLVDTFGRVVRDLRISVTDRCNFRCTYCMPAEGLPWLARGEILTPGEIERLARLFVDLGVRQIKLTGGEPTARAEIVDIVARLRATANDLVDGAPCSGDPVDGAPCSGDPVDGAPFSGDPVDGAPCSGDPVDLSMTTNGVMLARLATPLRESGLDRVTVSCDSLLRHRFAEMTRRDALEEVFDGLDAARAAGFEPVKLNCVVIAGTNDDEVVDFARLARERALDVRFIEYMPLDAEQRWEMAKVVASEAVRRVVEDVYPLVGPDPDGPAVRYTFADGAPGSIGFISSVSEPFCADCDRVRLTADGQLRACLFALDETDLRTPMRDGASDADLEELLRSAVGRKWAGHRIGRSDFVRPSRSMSQIGG